MADSSMGNPPGWLSDLEYKRVQATMPIVCVDVLPVRKALRGYPPFGNIMGALEVGLIRRRSPQGVRWGHLGGRLLRGEEIKDAIRRQVREALGDNVDVPIPRGSFQPVWVAEYFPEARPGFGVDPRQHCVSLVYAVDLPSEPEPRNEALEFRWFPADALPSLGPAEWDFDDGMAVHAAVARLVGAS